MWNSLNRALWLLPVLGVSSYAQNDTANETTKLAVIAASAEVSKALASRDEHTLRKWLAHDFVVIHGSGARESLAAFILRLLKGQDPFSAGITGKYDIDVKLIGNNGAVLTETVNTQVAGRSRWHTSTSVFRKSSDVWQVIHYQSSPFGEGIVETPEVLASYSRIAGEYRRSDGGRWNAGPTLDVSIRLDGKRLLMFGLFGQRTRQDPVIPQGGLEFQVSRFRLKFSLDGTGAAQSITATEDGKVMWTATRIP
jgi:hypothetical protein